MAAKGYCTYSDVQAFLGLTFTAGQQTQCAALIEQAEAFIDSETNRGWLMGAQTNEAFYHPGSKIFVRYTPVTTVSAITGRASMGADEVTLTVTTDYELRDAEAGYIYLVSPASYYQILVDYTPVSTVPADIKRACVELVATWMQSSLNPTSFGLDSYSLPDLTVKYNRSYNQVAMPPTVQAVIDRYRYWVHA